MLSLFNLDGGKTTDALVHSGADKHQERTSVEYITATAHYLLVSNVSPENQVQGFFRKPIVSHKVCKVG